MHDERGGGGERIERGDLLKYSGNILVIMCGGIEIGKELVGKKRGRIIRRKKGPGFGGCVFTLCGGGGGVGGGEKTPAKVTNHMQSLT